MVLGRRGRCQGRQPGVNGGPRREVWPTFETMIERVGPDQLRMWGTDMPFQNRFCTYRQSRVWIEKYCAFLDQHSLAKIMGGTAALSSDLRFGEDIIL